MAVILSRQAESYAQLLTVLVIFVVVLGATALTTKWIAGYQKKQGISGNVELLDAARLGNNKYIQLIRIGETYLAVAVCKDTVTLLGEIPADQIVTIRPAGKGVHMSFREMMKKIRQEEADEGQAGAEEPKEEEDDRKNSPY